MTIVETTTTTSSAIKSILEELRYKRMSEIIHLLETETCPTLRKYLEEVESGSLIEHLISSLLRLRERKNT